MNTFIRHLRYSMKQIFDAVKRAMVVTVYSHSKDKKDESFGMWKNYDESKNVLEFARKLRRGRNHDV